MAWRKIKICGLIFIGVIFFAAPLFYSKHYSFYRNKLEDIQVNNQVIRVEIADSSDKVTKGLSGRDSLCENCGMLFQFSERENYAFWMKGMEFDLDMIWIDGGSVVYVAKNVSYNFKGTITPDVPADKVLELNAGMADKLDIEIGDSISLNK
jgi:uncharacterized protein